MSPLLPRPSPPVCPAVLSEERAKPGKVGVSEERRDLSYTRSKTQIARHLLTSLNRSCFQLHVRKKCLMPLGMDPQPRKAVLGRS